jgi:antitoxin ParD1/3/4
VPTKRSSLRRALNPSIEQDGRNRHNARLALVFIFAYLEDIYSEATMSQTTTMTVRISGTLSEFVASNVGENGAYENISEYVRDLIRRDKERAEREAFERLKAELTRAFAAPEDSYRPLTAAEVIARNRG